MPRIKQEMVYQIDELSDRAKERAREWWRENCQSDRWYESMFDCVKDDLKLAGFSITKIYFSGFSSQGDGAMFEGTWRACDTRPVKAMKEHAPKDKTLHAIVARLRNVAKHYPDAHLVSKHRGHYYHEYCADLDADMGNDLTVANEKGAPDAEDALKEAARDAMRWVYKMLEAEYDWQMADEQVDESIRANEYEFTEEGRRA